MEEFVKEKSFLQKTGEKLNHNKIKIASAIALAL
jgi:hypothetical protein